MALIVEDGTIVDGAESYISVADASTIITNRGGSAEWDALTETQKEVQLRLATEYIDDNYKFLGCLVEPTQPLQFPRTGLAKYDSDEIPSEILKATSVLAYKSISNPLYKIEDQSNGAIKSQFDKLDVLETKTEYYSGGTGSAQIVFSEVKKILSDLTLGKTLRRG